MISRNVLVLAIAAAASLCAQSAFAQASAPLSRAQVKAETRAAEKAGQLTPAGQGGAPAATNVASGPTKTRAQRKAETMEARKAGQLTPAGQGGAPAATSVASGPTKTRAQLKAETLEAKKKGELVPAGQGSPAPTK